MKNAYVEECDVEAQLNTDWHLGTNEIDCVYLPSTWSLNIDRLLDTPILLVIDIYVYILTYKFLIIMNNTTTQGFIVIRHYN
jgi:hypothetical protein